MEQIGYIFIEALESMMKIIIELEFDERPDEAEVINYLNELIDNDCLGYYEEGV